MRNRNRPRCFILICVFAAAMGTARVRAGNIFDDDWTPPTPQKPIAKPESLSPTAADPPQTAPKPDSPALIPPTIEKPAANPVASRRRPVPDKSEQGRSRKLFKEAFARELVERSIAARKVLATRLMEEAAKTTDSPSDQYVLLLGALDAGREAADLGLCVKAADSLAESYNVDALRLKSDVVLKMPLRGDSAAVTAANCRGGFKLLDELIQAEDYGTASRVAAGLRAAAAGDVGLRRQSQDRANQIDALLGGQQRLGAQLEKLRANPGDPAANLSAGQFYCFVKRDWRRGLPMLASSGNAAMQSLALKEIAGASSPKDQMALADGWWDLAEKMNGVSKLGIQVHAGTLYERAAPDLTGLSKAHAQNRIQDLAVLTTGVPRPIDLLASMQGNPRATRENDITVLHGDGRIATASTFRPPITFQFVLMTDEQDTRLIYAADEIIFNWADNRDELRVGGGPIGGQHKQGAGRLPSNQWVTIELSVGLKELVITVDSVERYRARGDFSKVDQTLAVRSPFGEVRIKSIGIPQSGGK